ncbi:MAG TPA: polysaccharide deacetylase family protein [Paenibacillus sp.]|uniref:polysaccharide deacetylase family protein n=1 Tax=Paenibacillus sp. TaxID=58172 RepID=UPI002C1ADC82|nr:polysaccharide deacetylase family protein [Paenibacillus sp.]HUC91368.1 polysaccharide deacetylase family protein [Paenibacillus sp.]
MESILLWGFYLLTFYAFLPGFVSRTFGFRVFKRGRAEREIALTFDDGPDPRYTPLLLDLLARYGAKATFFVVGIHAEKHPELLTRMQAEGHIVGIHNYVHKTNWLMRPGAVKKQIHRTSDIIKKATGQRPGYYRPPWGIVNLFDFSKHGYLQIILWSAMFGDWRSRVGAGRLTQRMMKKLRPGEIVLLHDRGTTFGADEDAPLQMLEALETYMKAGLDRGYRFVTVKEMIAVTDEARNAVGADKRTGGASARKLGFFKRMAVSGWMAWERCFNVLFRIVDVGDGAIFHYRIRPYYGKTLVLADGRTIGNKDKVIELHFDNEKLLKVMLNSRSVLQTAIQLIREVDKALPKLAAHMEGRREFDEVKGLYGVSMMHRGPEAFGFSVLALPKGPFSFFTRYYLRLLMMVLHPSGKERLRDKQATLVPHIMAMSMDEFNRRYVTAGGPRQKLWKEPAVGAEAGMSLRS